MAGPGPLRCAADEVAVAGGEHGFAMPVLFEFDSGALHDGRRDGARKDLAAGIINQPLPRVRVEPVPQFGYFQS